MPHVARAHFKRGTFEKQIPPATTDEFPLISELRAFTNLPDKSDRSHHGASTQGPFFQRPGVTVGEACLTALQGVTSALLSDLSVLL